MNADPLSRTRLLLGDAALERLAAARVILFGLGGVGGHAAESLARCGVGAIDLVDDDVVSPSNLNRQLFATSETIGLPKTEAAAARLRAVAPGCRVTCHRLFYLPETAKKIDLSLYDYAIDAIDTVTAKLCLIAAAQAAGTPILSCMGTGNKLDPSLLRVSMLSETRGDPLARVMRKEAKKRGLRDFPVVWSPEEPRSPQIDPAALAEELRPGAGRRDLPGSAPFVPAAAGLLLASRVVRDLIG